MEDSTIMITEPKEMNSGIPQGVFLKRQAVMKSGTQDILVPADFFIGETVEIYGRQFKVTDADPYTRDFFKSAMKVELPETMPVPEDSFKKSQVPVVTKKDKMMIDFLEHSLGGGKVASQKQFLDNDRKVLKFNVHCDGEPFIIHYYLADDTMDIRQVHFPNNGKDRFPLLLKR